MRLAAKRRNRQWMHSEMREASWTSQVLFTPRGVMEVMRAGRGEPIVLVPGLAGGWRLLDPLARRLARTNEVILYDLAGDRAPFGAPRHATVTDYARDLAELIGQLRLERPAVLGVSFGGAVALELAVEMPRVPGALILSGAEARFHVGLGATVARRLLERYPLPHDVPFLNQFFNLLHGGRPESRALAEFVVERCWETDQAVMASRLRAIEGFDVSDRLWRVEVPTLVLAGTRDVIVPPARQRALAESIPDAQFAPLTGGGHIGFLTHRSEIALQVARLLNVAQHSPL